mmetsp:Transcript_24688/g.54270  ORF Transcript_24688/g.54270 Transcript_24688/m.54270 type:complete len:130 (-) Transcript_24688:363-752(-)
MPWWLNWECCSVSKAAVNSGGCRTIPVSKLAVEADEPCHDEWREFCLQLSLNRDDDCAICTEALGGPAGAVVPVTMLPCCHVFHQACAEIWLSEMPRCPCCQSDVATIGRIALAPAAEVEFCSIAGESR